MNLILYCFRPKFLMLHLGHKKLRGLICIQFDIHKMRMNADKTKVREYERMNLTCSSCLSYKQQENNVAPKMTESEKR